TRLEPTARPRASFPAPPSPGAPRRAGARGQQPDNSSQPLWSGAGPRPPARPAPPPGSAMESDIGPPAPRNRSTDPGAGTESAGRRRSLAAGRPAPGSGNG